MKLNFPLSTILIAAPALSAALPGSTSITFDPKAGLELKKSFTTSLAIEAVELTSTMNGVEVPQEYLPDVQMQLEYETEVVVHDEYLAVKGGRPTALRREYQTLVGSGLWVVEVPPEPEDAGDFETTCDLEGETVEFRWDEKEGEYVREQLDASEPSEQLDALDPDLDLLAFLPGKEVEVGDRWEIELDAIGALLNPGGKLGLASNPDDEASAGFEDGPVDGEVKARLARVLEEDGRRVAVIAVEGEYVYEQHRATDLEHIPVVDGTGRDIRTAELSLEGELRWDLRAGHAISLEITGEVELTSETIRDPDQPGPTFTSTLFFDGERKIAVSFAVE